ncbi:alpha/beta fold hydrolase [Alteromonadaceae bacterium BrNp21-10]|nr:alpha/beta fold hydrolase [Alteromonadaceae bacterium BrNp21-10]
MNLQLKAKRAIPLLMFTILVISACTNQKSSTLMIAEQGSFAVGGTIVKKEGTFDPIKLKSDGQTLHGDHAYVFYQTPVNERKYPMVMWHGYGQFSKTWESTPDGREGYQNIFLRKGYGVYLIDQPRRGNAGKGTQASTYAPEPDEQKWFNIFRIGKWPEYFSNVQFPTDPASLDQYFRQMTPDIGPIDINVNANAVDALFDKIGDGILVTHSHSGGMGWQAAMQNPHIKAIVSYEPGSNFVFPEGKAPAPKQSSSGALSAVEISLAEFKKLTQIPIVIYYGDNIPQQPSGNPGQDGWRVRLEMAYEWANTINQYGGDATVVHLPKVGIYGNTHFPFSDLNNRDIAELMADWLHDKKLD